MKLTDMQRGILIKLIQNELEYYEQKEDTYKEDIQYIKELMKVYTKLGGK